MQFNDRDIVIKNGGRVELCKWNSILKTVEATDVSDCIPLCLLNYNVILDENVTLRDIFLIIQRDMDLYVDLLNNWVDEIVSLGLSTDDYVKSPDNNLKHIEFQWRLGADLYKEYPQAPVSTMPEVYAVGLDENGENTTYGIDFIDTREIIDLPVKLNRTVKFSEININYKKNDSVYKEYKGAEFRLIDILNGLIWELSFFGNPKKKQEFINNILKSDDEQTLSTLDEAFKDKLNGG